MSLDVYLNLKGEHKPISERVIPVRENGTVKMLTREEWDAKFPNCEPFIPSETEESNQVFTGNITHNLNEMAGLAGIHDYLWRPEEVGVRRAAQLINPLREGLFKLKANPDSFRKFNPPNGWGDYEGLVSFVKQYLVACELYPEATVSVWR